MSISMPVPVRAAVGAAPVLPHGLWTQTVRGLRLASQFGLLWVILSAGGWLATTLALPLPGNLAGMLLLLGLLWTGVVRLAWVQDLSTILVRHLMLFFIPLAVGLMVWQDLLASTGLIIAASLLVSAVVGMLAAGITAQVTAAAAGTARVS